MNIYFLHLNNKQPFWIRIEAMENSWEIDTNIKI